MTKKSVKKENPSFNSKKWMILLTVILALELLINLLSLNVLYNIANSNGKGLKGNLATMTYNQCVEYCKQVVDYWIEDEIELRTGDMWKQIQDLMQKIRYDKREIEILKEQLRFLDPIKEASKIYMINEWIKAYQAQIELFEKEIKRLDALRWTEVSKIINEAKEKLAKDIEEYCDSSSSYSYYNSDSTSYYSYSGSSSGSSGSSSSGSSGSTSSDSGYSSSPYYS